MFKFKTAPFMMQISWMRMSHFHSMNLWENVVHKPFRDTQYRKQNNVKNVSR